jgi:CRISPR-associated protein Csy3
MFGRGLQGLLQEAVGGTKTGANLKLANRIGVVSEFANASLANSRFADSVGSGFAQKSAEVVVRASGLGSYTESMQAAFGLELAANIAENFSKKLDDVPFAKMLKEYGIDDAKKSEPNPVSSDNEDANLPHDKDTLKVSFSLRIIGNVGKPFACNKPDFENAVNKHVKAYKDAGEGLKILALRYAYNIANGRFLWRNRVCSEKISIHVKMEADPKGFWLNAYDFSLKGFDTNNDDDDLKRLAGTIYSGLKGGDSSFTFVEVNAYVKLGNGQHVFPSQEMNMGEKKKVLFQLDKCAAIHNVKIGNAIRTIDNWYQKAEFPIAIEPYGSVTQMGQAYRKSKDDLYTLMLDWLNEKDNVSVEAKNFVVANFIRGGVFGGKGE